MPSTITWSAPTLAPILAECGLWTYLKPLDLNYGPSHPGDPLAPLYLMQACTSLSTSIYNPSTQTFTVSLQGTAWQTRTQTIPASTRVWTSDFVRSYTVEYQNVFFTGDVTVVTVWPSSLTILTDTPSPQPLAPPSTTSKADADATTTASAPSTAFPDNISSFSAAPAATLTTIEPSTSTLFSLASSSSSYTNLLATSSTLSAPAPASIPSSTAFEPATPSTESQPTSSSTSGSSSSTSSTKNTPNIYTAVIPAVLSAFILISLILLLRHYRHRRNTKAPARTTAPSIVSKAWQRFSALSPSSSHRTLWPEESLSQRDSLSRGRPRTRDGLEARRSSLLRKARERFIARESAIGMSQMALPTGVSHRLIPALGPLEEEIAKHIKQI